MQRTVRPHVAAAIALVGAGIVATTPVTTPPPASHPVKVATVQNIDLLSLSSALVGVIEGLRSTVDTSAASLETGLGQTRDTTYLTAKAIIDSVQTFDLSVSDAVRAQAGTIPVLGSVVAQLADGAGTIGYQGLGAVDLAIKIGSQLAFDAAAAVPLEAATVTDFVAKTVIGVLNAVPAPLAAASTTNAPLQAAAVTDASDADTAPPVKPGTNAAKAVSAAANAANKAAANAVSSVLRGLHPPKTKKPAATNTVTTASSSDTSGDTKSPDGAGSTDSAK